MKSPCNVIWPAEPGDTREVSERLLEQIHLAGKYDSYSQIHQLDGCQWKVQNQISHPSGDTLHTLLRKRVRSGHFQQGRIVPEGMCPAMTI